MRVFAFGIDDKDDRWYNSVKSSDDTISDEALVDAVCAREQGALAELYNRHATHLMSIACRVLHNRSDAEDLLHDVFLEVWNRAGNYSAARGKVKTWLILLTRSRAIDRLRALGVARRFAMAAPPIEEAQPAHAEPDAMADQGRVRDATHRLNDPQRIVLQLSYFEGLSCREIAERCGTPIGTVKSRLRAALHTLQKEFGVHWESI